MIDKNTFNKNIDFHGVKGLIFIGEKIIVFRRDDKTENFPLMIDLPGGGKEGDESPFETFKREIKEELFIDIIDSDIIYSKKYQSVIDPSKEAYFIVAKPLNIKESDVVLGSEGLEFFLITPQEFIDLPDGIQRQQTRVRDYLDFQKVAN